MGDLEIDSLANLSFLFLTLIALSFSIVLGAWEGAGLYQQFFVPLSFVSLGIMVKYGDQAFDTDAFNQRVALFLSVPGGLLMGSLIAVDINAAIIFLGLLFSLLFAGKLDNLAFKIGFVLALAVGASFLLLGMKSVSVLGIIAVFSASLLDERVNDMDWVANGDGTLTAALKQRPFLKTVVLVLCVFSVLSSFIYLFAFLAFDFGYSYVESVSVNGGWFHH